MTLKLGHVFAGRVTPRGDKPCGAEATTPSPVQSSPTVLSPPSRPGWSARGGTCRIFPLRRRAVVEGGAREPVSVAAATAITDDYARAYALTSLAPHLSPDQLAAALSAATAITGHDYRAQALTGLAPHLHPDQLPTALSATTAITSHGARAHTLTSLAPHLPPNDQLAILAQALAAATAITDDNLRAQALIHLAPHLPAELIPEL